jgi:phosphopantothenoylcysteine synthetase/decarboxylase
MNSKKRLALFVTGSIAAIKTLSLVNALRKTGYDTTVFLTRAPEEWKWVSPKEAEAASGHPVFTETSEKKAHDDALLSSSIILVAPATADFLSQLAYASTERARSILEAQKRGSLLMLAPAMNYRMWQHATVQRNCAALSTAGAIILGPAKGLLACGDEGYGRMIEVKDIAAGVDAALKGDPRASRLYAIARKEGVKPVPFRATEKEARILIALSGANVSWPFVERLVADIVRTKVAAEYVIDPSWAKDRAKLDALTHQRAVMNYFDIPEFEGMEHIRLPERSVCVFFPFLEEPLATAMAEGKADTLLLGVYLASKVPVVTTEETLHALSPALAQSLRRDGLGTAEDFNELARLYARGGKTR